MTQDQGSFLGDQNVEILSVAWHSDEYGPYWVGSFRDNRTGKRGVTGTYYDLDEDGQRPPREIQEKELATFGWSKP